MKKTLKNNTKFEKLLEKYADIEFWLFEMGIKKYKINDNLTVDVDGYVDISNKRLTIIPVQFRNVAGNFFCYSNKFTNLKGSPKKVGGTFACENNNLISLLGAPEEVWGDFDCHDNKLTSLDYLPKFIGGEINISKNLLKESVDTIFSRNDSINNGHISTGI